MLIDFQNSFTVRRSSKLLAKVVKKEFHCIQWLKWKIRGGELYNQYLLARVTIYEIQGEETP